MPYRKVYARVRQRLTHKIFLQRKQKKKKEERSKETLPTTLNTVNHFS